MRISTNTMTYGFLNSMNKSLNRMNTLQEQLSDGKLFHRPSDDPIRAIRALKLNTNLTTNEQFTQNIKDGISWLQTTDGALSSASTIMQRAKELVIDAVSPNPSIAYTTAAEELDGLINQLITIGNTQIGDRYVFSGQKDQLAAGMTPFTRIGDTVTYNGDVNKISMPMQAGPVNSAQDSINVTGTEIYGGNLDLINHLIEIKNELASGDPDMDFLSGTALTNIDADHDRLLLAQTEIGNRMAMFELTQGFLESDNVTITENVSANEDVDIAKAMIDFKTNEMIYNSALSVGAKILPKSLVDFLS